MARKSYPIELLTTLYFLSYLPYIMIARYLATVEEPAIGRPLTGEEVLPAMLIVAALITFLFSWWVGWFKNVHRVRIGPFAIPFARRYTFISGLCTAVILTAVPLSYMLTDVSIPLIQLLMRGDILIIAPLVDLIAGRRVRWWSYTALVLVAIGMIVAFTGRGSLWLPPSAIAIIVLYTAAYFGRLVVMTKISKNGDPEMVRIVFLEEKIVGFPLALLGLGLLSAFGGGEAAEELRLGFVGIWSMSAMLPLVVCGTMVFLTGIFATFILLDARENSYCVPLERSASIVAGVVGSALLAVALGFKMPSNGELFGASLLIIAIIVLALGPRWSANRAAGRAGLTEAAARTASPAE